MQTFEKFPHNSSFCGVGLDPARLSSTLRILERRFAYRTYLFRESHRQFSASEKRAHNSGQENFASERDQDLNKVALAVFSHPRSTALVARHILRKGFLALRSMIEIS
ncbi:hypothetical protein CBS115988_4986 [Aspergillus niger]|nr:hypothetical protein CBS11232_5411 [Aspergillus niger]KAI2875978.1 hypothetical protein CBS115988_4986 [Aspergillus niger]